MHASQGIAHPGGFGYKPAMSSIYLFPAAGFLTLICTWFVWSSVRSFKTNESMDKKPAIEIFLMVSILLTIVGCFKLEPVTDQGIRFSLASSVAIATLLVQSMYLIGLWQHGIRGLGLILLPVTGVPLLLVPFLPHSATEHWIHTSSVLETGHLLISLLAYAILTLAAIHAIVLLMLDRALKKKKISPIMQAMPSLFEIEIHLFAQVRWAITLLALGILTGLTWQWVEFQHFALLSHKVLLALFSFTVLAILLSKRKKSGWHGRRASYMVIAAYSLLLLAYFGARLISSWLA